MDSETAGDGWMLRSIGKVGVAMDGDQFDDLAKRFCSTRLTRLSALRRAAGGAVALMTGVLIAASESDAKGKKRKTSKRKKNGTKRRNGRAVGTQAVAGACRPSGHPCEGNQECCSGLDACLQTGPGSAFRCVDNPECGASGQPCCPGGVCEEGLTCVAGTCKPINPQCGGLDQECCQGGVCQGGLECVGGTCKPACGAAGQACCAANPPCGADLVCSGGFCVVPCGGESQVCCAGSSPCGDGLVCAGNKCVPCGGVGEVCCQTDPACDSSNLVCIADRTCAPCGQEGQVCCANNACAAPLTCLANSTCGTSSGPPAPATCPGVPCPEGTVCVNGQCVSFGIACKSGETAEQCCFRSVKKGCKRKQASSHAKKNCRRKGKKRCNQLLAGV